MCLSGVCWLGAFSVSRRFSHKPMAQVDTVASVPHLWPRLRWSSPSGIGPGHVFQSSLAAGATGVLAAARLGHSESCLRSSRSGQARSSCPAGRKIDCQLQKTKEGSSSTCPANFHCFGKLVERTGQIWGCRQIAASHTRLAATTAWKRAS